MIDVAVAIDAESVGATLYQAQPAAYDARGNAIKPAPVSSSIRIAIQPAGGRLLRDLPEGIREEVSAVGWSRTPVLDGNEILHVARGVSRRYRVVHLWDRPMDGFNKFALKRII